MRTTFDSHTDNNPNTTDPMPTINDLLRAKESHQMPSARTVLRRIEIAVLEGECPHCQASFRREVETPLEVEKPRFLVCDTCRKDFRPALVIPFPESPCPSCHRPPR